MKHIRQGLVADIWPVIKTMKFFGHYFFRYTEDDSSMKTAFRGIYSILNISLVTLHFIFGSVSIIFKLNDIEGLVANAISTFFALHAVTKLIYFAIRRNAFYQTLDCWDVINSHPMFAESNLRYKEIAIKKVRRLVLCVSSAILLFAAFWSSKPFFASPFREIENGNETMIVEGTLLIVDAWYPWSLHEFTFFAASYLYQLYWLIFCMFQVNSLDMLFCAWMIYSIEQLKHLKEIMTPLVELSAGRDPDALRKAELWPEINTIDNTVSRQDTPPSYQAAARNRIYPETLNVEMERSMVISDFAHLKEPIIAYNSDEANIGDNVLTIKQQVYVRSAIKYWVERHKHVVRFIESVENTYGFALLLHMLTSTITLTLLAYEATKISAFDVYAMNVIGYLLYNLLQVFMFCIFGNNLIEESISVMKAAYECPWYNGSEEAKTFIQIVCQQCQRALSISGAKFFTVSLDLFASVLGAVVTYFMVLIQLK